MQVCKSFYYVQSLVFLTEVMLPCDEKEQSDAEYLAFVLMTNHFSMFYFHYWPSMLLGCLQICIYWTAASTFQADTNSLQVVMHMTYRLLLWFLIVTFIHVIVTKIGLMYI